jgi:hypothetical protein
MKLKKQQPLRIYVAGPYCPMLCDLHDASRLAQRNTDVAIVIGNALIEKGHFVFVPHVSHYIHTHASCKRDYGEWWYDEDMTFLDHWATALYYISPSKGADLELQKAQQLGLKIFRSLDEVPEIPKSKPWGWTE